MNPRPRSDAGLATIELVLLLPVALLIVGFLVLAGRLTTAHADVVAAARDAARAASLAGTHTTATDAADSTARDTLAHRQVTCTSLEVSISDPNRFTPGGEVTVDVACTVRLADLAIPGLPGTRPVTASSTEIIDRYRGGGDDELGIAETSDRTIAPVPSQGDRT